MHFFLVLGFALPYGLHSSLQTLALVLISRTEQLQKSVAEKLIIDKYTCTGTSYIDIEYIHTMHGV